MSKQIVHYFSTVRGVTDEPVIGGETKHVYYGVIIRIPKEDYEMRSLPKAFFDFMENMDHYKKLTIEGGRFDEEAPVEIYEVVEVETDERLMMIRLPYTSTGQLPLIV